MLLKNSRDRKKAYTESLEKDISKLRYEWDRLKQVYEKHINQIHEINDVVQNTLCEKCKLDFRAKIRLKAETYDKFIENSSFSKASSVTSESSQLRHNTRESNTWVSTTTNIKEANSSFLECDETFELDPSDEELKVKEKSFKLPLKRKRKTPAITIELGSNLTLNLFTIFCSVALVAWFLWISLCVSTYNGTNLNQDILTYNTISQPRILHEISDTEQLNSSKSFNSHKHSGIYDQHYNPENFLQFMTAQRYNFFRKVETDYLNEPENETLEIFKPDSKTKHDTNLIVKQRLVNGESETVIKHFNSKYKNIDSLFCDYSAVFTEDLRFLYNDDLNYLHLLIRKKGIEIISDDENKRQNESTKDQNDLLEIGWKVFSLTNIDMQD